MLQADLRGDTAQRIQRSEMLFQLVSKIQAVLKYISYWPTSCFIKLSNQAVRKSRRTSETNERKESGRTKSLDLSGWMGALVSE